MSEQSCPKCRSTQVRVLSGVYPKGLECEKCGYLFLEGKQALIDE